MAKESKAPRAPKAPKEPKPPKAEVPRYGTAEWYGRDMVELSPEKRQEFGGLAVTKDIKIAPTCPYLSSVVPESRCNKPGGVCTIQRFRKTPDGSVEPVPGDKIVSVCPARFLQPLEDGKTLFQWIAQEMLDTDTFEVASERPFLRQVGKVASSDESKEDRETRRKAGRIDWIIVKAPIVEDDPIWCAVETQSLYFSGEGRAKEFALYAEKPSPILWPTAIRRPDYRSSGPKRLSPQLDIKVPALEMWHKKTAVVIDRHFLSKMYGLTDHDQNAKTPKGRRDNAQVVWFVVDHKLTPSGWVQIPHCIKYSSLKNSLEALSAAVPMDKDEFNRDLIAKLKASKSKAHE